MLRIVVSVLFAALLAVPIVHVQAQSIDTLWTKAYWCGYWDEAKCVQETSDHGFIIVTASMMPSRTDYDIGLIKTDSLGVEEWTRYIGDAHSEQGMHVLPTYDGGYLVSAQSTIVGSSGGAGGLWIVKTDADGDTLWTFPYCPGNRAAYPLHARQLSDSSYAVTGMINTSSGSKDAFLLRISQDGDALDFGGYGGTEYQESYFAAQLPDSGFIMAGTDRNTSTTENDWWVVRVDDSLDVTWDSTYALTSGYDIMGSACATDDGLVMVGKAGSVGHILKVDFDGHTLWSKTLTLGYTTETFNSIQPTVDGGFIVGGQVQVSGHGNNFSFIRLNDAGDSLWTYWVGAGEEVGRSVVPASDGGYVMAGTSQAWVNGSCVWLVKIGEPSCCVERVGDVNGLNGDEPTIGDVSMLIDALFISMDVDALPCLSEADVNQSGGANPVAADLAIGDIMMLIDYLFITGPELGLNECL